MRGKDIVSLSNCLLVEVVQNRKQKNSSPDSLARNFIVFFFTDVCKHIFLFLQTCKIRAETPIRSWPLDSVLSVCFKCQSQRERAGKAIFLHVFTLEIAGDLRDMSGYSKYI
jgi:hypothetical protein